MRVRDWAVAAGLFMALAGAASAHGTYPDRPIKVVVPAAA
ncbi:MAG: ABC transporter substrate-binding protein, partial [Bradyrhizobium icense]